MLTNEQMRAENQRLAYERYVEAMREDFAPKVGEFATNLTTDLSTAVATPFTLGIAAVARPEYSQFQPKSPEKVNSFETYANPIGEIALAKVVKVQFPNTEYTPREAILAQAA